MRLAGVLALTLATTGISVGFNLLGRDFYNALASKDQEQFVKQLLYYLGAFIGGIPVFVTRDYKREILALHWRAWMTKHYMQQYFQNRTFYNIQSQSLIDNPDQRIVDDINAFASTSIGFSMALFSAAIDLISFSGILLGIYPPLFAVLVVYSFGGTLISVALGKGLINLNFMQEKREADFRYGLVRIRENAESIAFYGGEGSELQLLLDRFKESFLNYSQLLLNQRNLDFFTSGYRYLIQLLPAAVVAPLYFAGKIEFGVINQSFSAFNHVLSDFSIIVYQFQSISSFSAVVERLGELSDVLEQQNLSFESSSDKISHSDANETLCVLQPRISILDVKQFVNSNGGEHEKGEKGPLLKIDNLTLQTPQYTATLVKNLSLVVNEGEHLLIMGPSGAGKTSLLRAIAGLWQAGKGTIKRYLRYEKKDGIDSLERSEDGHEINGVVRVVSADKRMNARESTEEVKQNRSSCDASDVLSNSAAGHDIDTAQMLFFLPQRPYLVLGTLRQQVLYPRWHEGSVSSLSSPVTHDSPSHQRHQPSDRDLIDVLGRVSLSHLLKYCNGLDSRVEWANVLSLGEQQRLAFARLLVSKPRLVLLDESTSSLDEENEALLYRELLAAGITYISVGHRSSLRQFHNHLLTLAPLDDNVDCKNWLFAPMKKESTFLGSAN
ncbi:hypothetical protein O6H91_07G005600 [Diphasiastrum complanatum]|nr:hypothetical protein O6H91_07G005600 [Diphasiastrum complanatum]